MTYFGQAIDKSDVPSSPTGTQVNALKFTGAKAILDSNSTWTMAGWVKPNTIPPATSDVRGSIAFGTNKVRVGFRAASGEVQVVFVEPNDTYDYVREGNALSPVADEWHLVVITYDSGTVGINVQGVSSGFVVGDNTEGYHASEAGDAFFVGQVPTEAGQGDSAMSDDITAVGDVAVWDRVLTEGETTDLCAGMRFRDMHFDDLLICAEIDGAGATDIISGETGTTVGTITAYTTKPLWPKIELATSDSSGINTTLPYLVSKTALSDWRTIFNAPATSTKRWGLVGDSTATQASGQGGYLMHGLTALLNQRYGKTPSVVLHQAYAYDPGSDIVPIGGYEYNAATSRTASGGANDELPRFEVVQLPTQATIGNREWFEFEPSFTERYTIVAPSMTAMDTSALAFKVYGEYVDASSLLRVQEYHGGSGGTIHTSALHPSGWNDGLSAGDYFVTPSVPLATALGGNRPRLTVDSQDANTAKMWALELIDTNASKGVTLIPITSGGYSADEHYDDHINADPMIAALDLDVVFIFLGANDANNAWAAGTNPPLWYNVLTDLIGLYRTDDADKPIVLLPMQPYRDGKPSGGFDKAYGYSNGLPLAMANVASELDNVLFFNTRRAAEEGSGWDTIPAGDDNSGITGFYSDAVHWQTESGVDAWLAAFSQVLSSAAGFSGSTQAILRTPSIGMALGFDDD